MDIEIKISNEPIDYKESLEFMESRVNDIILGKKPEMLWLLEHPPIYTAGTSAKEGGLIDNGKFPVFKTGRGGEYTYHGPGQRVVYVMLNLKQHYSQPDLKQYVHDLEEWIIRSLKRVGVNGERKNGRIGIWVTYNNKEKKVAALGIRVRKWVAYHGIAININPDLKHFKGIVPCGIREYGVTSLEELGIEAENEEVNTILIEEFKKIF